MCYFCAEILTEYKNMAILAIRGHATRGKEVIEILEMLGGKNQNNVYSGKDTFHYYFIDNENGYIRTKLYTDDCWTKLTYNIFTLVEFFEKFPYKVGDRVTNYNDIELEVVRMYWDNIYNVVRYDVREVANKTHSLYSLMTAHLQPYKEENMKKREYKELRMSLDDNDKLATEATIDGNKIMPPNGYLIGKITQVDNGMLVEYVKKQLQYPKTYKECCEVLSLGEDGVLYTKGYKASLIQVFQKLFICRNAYWKIAGEEMELGKPWKPDYTDKHKRKYSIWVDYDEIKTGGAFITTQMFLTFPTEKMRDVFYENFKKEIEECKEFL